MNRYPWLRANKSHAVSPERTKICCARYGNVMCSRSSVIPLFIDQIKYGKSMTVTEPKMTRSTLTEFNSNNIQLLDVEQVKEKLLSFQYIWEELAAWKEQ